MNDEKNVTNLPVNQPYERKIFGLGEIYEIMSVEKIRKRLLQKYPEAEMIFLSANKNHIQRGLTINELATRLLESNLKIIKKGYADSPPWKSNPRGEHNMRIYPAIIVIFSKIIFYFLVRIEFLWESPRKSHMIYCLAKRK